MSAKVSASGRHLIRRAIACGWKPELGLGARQFLNERKDAVRRKRGRQ